MQIALVLSLLVITLIIFPLEIISVDIVALSALLILVAAGVLTPDQAFAGFGTEMMILLGSIFVIAGALLRTGMLDSIGVLMYRHFRGRYRLLLVATVTVVAAVSAFMNNTVVTAVFIPVVLAVARRSKLAPSKLLIPVAYAAMLGGCCTLIGTSTNLAASSFLVRQGIEPFGLFEFLPIGLAMTAGGILFFMYFGGALLPSRGLGDVAKDYRVKEYLTEVALRPGCPLIGKRIDEAGVQEMADVTVLGILRPSGALLAPEGHEQFELNDTLLLKGEVEGIQKLRQTPGIESKGDDVIGDISLESEKVRLVEVMIGPGSRFIGRSLKEIDFRRRYGLTTLAIHRHAEEVVEKVGKIPLMIGDVLLVQGPEARLNDLRAVANVLVLSDLSHFLLERSKGTYVVVFFGAALALGALGILPIGPAVLGAAIMSVLVGAVGGEEAYRLIDWRLVMLIGAMTGFGQAMVNTGADKFLADQLLGITGQFGPRAILAGFFVLTVALSQPLSNAAAALAVLPIALATATLLGVNPRTFAVVVTLAASASFITPLEPSCILVYPAGRYRYFDFVRAGAPLTLVTMIIVLILAPLLWPL
jgi:di/tricarboxylate transporter